VEPGRQRLQAQALLRTQPPREGVRPRWSGLRVQGTASSPLSATGLANGTNGASLDWPRLGAHSSAGERPLHTREVAGSIPAAPITEHVVTGIWLNHAVQVCQNCRERASGADLGADLGSRLIAMSSGRRGHARRGSPLRASRLRRFSKGLGVLRCTRPRWSG
jgi:hypothetical protein